MEKLVSELCQVFHFLRENTGAIPSWTLIWLVQCQCCHLFFFPIRIILKAKTKRSFKSGRCVAHRNNLQSKLLWGICRRFHCSALNQFKLRAAGWTDESTGVLLSTPGSRKSTDSASLKWNPPLAYNGFSRRCPLMSMQAGIHEL